MVLMTSLYCYAQLFLSCHHLSSCPCSSFSISLLHRCSFIFAFLFLTLAAAQSLFPVVFVDVECERRYRLLVRLASVGFGGHCSLAHCCFAPSHCLCHDGLLRRRRQRKFMNPVVVVVTVVFILFFCFFCLRRN